MEQVDFLSCHLPLAYCGFQGKGPLFHAYPKQKNTILTGIFVSSSVKNFLELNGIIPFLKDDIACDELEGGER
jgi:hypothetical protein